MELAVSTTAFRGQSIEKILEIARTNDLRIEFSSGLPFRADLETIFLKADCKRLLHNYCPAPQVPFVLNLASLDPAILEKTLAHCLKCLRMVAESKTGFYSVHAGFCLDPDPRDLGKKLTAVMTHPREEYWDRFLRSVATLLQEAERLGVKLFIENNVLAAFNLLPNGVNPLLCADPLELEKLAHEFQSSAFGLLIDTGHLKVSAKTLGFSEEDALIRLESNIKAFHHSDNDGRTDSNGAFREDYWFLKFANRFRQATHILEVHHQDVDQIRHQYRLLETAAAREVSKNASST